MRLGVRHIAAVATVSVSALATLACTAPSSPGVAPAGEDQTYPGHVPGSPPPPTAPLRDGERFVQVGLAAAYKPAPPPGGTDEYRCFLIDPKLNEASFITGSQFLPENNEIVHHAILYKIAASEVDHAKSVDAATDGDGWRCFGGTGLSSSFSFGGAAAGETYIGGWAPGGKESLIAGIAGYRVEPGSQIVLQVHYNLLATNAKP